MSARTLLRVTWAVIISLIFVLSTHAQTEPDPLAVYPAPTVVLKFEQIPNCKGCSSFEYTFYSDTSVKYVGHEAVFWLGESISEYNRIQEYRTYQPKTSNDYGYALAHRKSYRDYLALAADSNSRFGKRMARVRESGFFNQKSEPGDGTSQTDLQLMVDWQGENNTVCFPENNLPPWFKTLFDSLISGSKQVTATFWSDDKAVLWVSQGRAVPHLSKHYWLDCLS